MMYSLAQLDALSKEMWTFGVGWLRGFILILSSTLSCFCKEIWTLGIGCLHDVYTCGQLFSHRQEVNSKTFNISVYIYLKFKDFPVICKESYTLHTSMLHVEMMEKAQKKCRMYWKYQAIGVLQTFSLHF